MPGSNADFWLDPSAECKMKLEQMKRATITPEMRRNITVATSSAVPALKAAARSLPSQGKYARGGLRADLAKGVKRIIKGSFHSVTATIAIKGGKSAPLANLGRAVEGEIVWTHPVFGNPGTEVTQTAKPFFYRTMNAMLPIMNRAFKRAGKDYERKL
jgi:predicted deacylase